MATNDLTDSTVKTAPSMEALKALFADCADFECREIRRAGGAETVSLCWFDGLVTGREVAEDVLRPLAESDGGADAAERALSGAVWACSATRRETLVETAEDLLRGCCAVLFGRGSAAVTFEVKTAAARAVGEPKIEKTVKGARDAFVETLRVNTSLVRRKLRSPRLKLRQARVGRRSGTDLALLYIEGVVNPDTLAELERRLGEIDIDGLLAAGNLEQYLTDRPGSPFPQLLHTERPDTFAAELLAGRAGLLVDGLPVGFLLPAPLSCFLRVSEDRGSHWLVASLLMLLRWASAFLSLTLPGFFTALSMYHQEMIPTALLLSMVESKQQVPFSEAFEIIGMLLAFELLMEAGLRLPDPVGNTVSIIGGLIVGQSAVEAKVLSPISVIIVSAAAICGFTMPSRDLGAALRIGRLALVVLAIALGMFGLALGVAALAWYLCTMDSFGVPYLSPMAEGGFREVLKAFVRLPLPADKYRERALRTPDRRNQK